MNSTFLDNRKKISQTQHLDISLQIHEHRVLGNDNIVSQLLLFIISLFSN